MVIVNFFVYWLGGRTLSAYDELVTCPGSYFRVLFATIEYGDKNISVAPLKEL